MARSPLPTASELKRKPPNWLAVASELKNKPLNWLAFASCASHERANFPKMPTSDHTRSDKGVLGKSGPKSQEMFHEYRENRTFIGRINFYQAFENLIL